MKQIGINISFNMRFLMGLLATCLAFPTFVLAQQANTGSDSTKIKAAVTVTSGTTMDSTSGRGLFAQSQSTKKSDNYQYNYPTRKSVVVNFCPYLHIKTLYFYNHINANVGCLLSWSNIGTQPIIAFEVATVEYNPVGEVVTNSEQLLFNGIVIPGNGTGNFNPLQPTEYASDFLGKPNVNRYVVAVYVKSARLGDGKIWRANKFQVDAVTAAALEASR